MENTDVSSSAAAAELLKAHGFSDAAKILLDTPPPSLSASTLYALAAQPPSVPLAPRFIVSTFSSSDREPKRFLETYKRLRSFVNTSLDVVRTELTPLVYLVFVHLYLALLLRKSDADKREAKAFFRAVHGEHKLDHQEEVFALEKLGSADAVSKSDTAMTFIEHRFVLKISKMTWMLLMAQLAREDMTVVAMVVNNHVHVVIADDDGNAGFSESGLVPPEAVKGIRGGGGPMNAEPLPSPLRWGRLMTEGERAEAPGIVPLPKPDRQLGAAAANEVKFCTKLGIGGKLPSVAMFTAMHCSSSLNVLTFSRDGSTSAIGLADSTIHVFDAENRFSSRSLHGHSSSVFGLSFSPSARILASSSSDSNICLWGCDAATGSGPLAFLKGHVGAVWDICFAPRGNYIASCGRDRTARVWSTDRAAPLRILPGHVTDVDTVRWHPNCNYVATGGGDKSIRLWDVQSGETVRLMTGHNGSVTSLAFSPDGLTLASGSDTGAVLLWDLRSGKRVATTQQHKGPVWSLDFDAGEGGILASGAADCSVRLWNVPTMGSTDNSAGDGHGAKANGPNEHNHIDDVPDDAGLPPKPTTTTTGPLPFQPSLLKVLYTKSTPCIALQFTKRNLLLAGGACSLGMS